ncbi:MAG TPA: hypothetical protein VGJ28_02380, partial [Micromonosporaceae bacterium]
MSRQPDRVEPTPPGQASVIDLDHRERAPRSRVSVGLVIVVFVAGVVLGVAIDRRVSPAPKAAAK